MKNAFKAIILLVVILGVIGVLTYFSYSNQEVQLRNSFNAQQKNCTVVYDQVWKIIQQQAGVASKYADDFKEIYPDLINARYGKGDGTLMKWIVEHNPNFDTSLYGKLMNSIEVQRTTFTEAQKKLIDVKREHDNIRTTFPGQVFVGGRPELVAQLVTSTKTEKAFQTGKEDEVDLFGPKKD